MLILSDLQRYRLSELHYKLQKQVRLFQNMIHQLSLIHNEEAKELKYTFEKMLLETRYQIQYLKEVLGI